MELGAFSVSLAVKDIAASRAFYEKLGFVVFGREQAKRWLIMKNGGNLIGLFQGMLEKNMLTFNPGWDSDAKPLAGFTDVREIPASAAVAGRRREPGGRRCHRGSGTHRDHRSRWQ